MRTQTIRLFGRVLISCVRLALMANDNDRYSPEDIPGLILAALIIWIIAALVYASWTDVTMFIHEGWAEVVRVWR
jgi:hypothetical protein